MVNGIILKTIVVGQVAVFFQGFKKFPEIVVCRHKQLGYASASHTEVLHDIVAKGA
jgi:hypothetical protein